MAGFKAGDAVIVRMAHWATGMVQDGPDDEGKYTVKVIGAGEPFDGEYYAYDEDLRPQATQIDIINAIFGFPPTFVDNGSDGITDDEFCRY